MIWHGSGSNMQDIITNTAICGCALCCCVQAFFEMSSCITAPYLGMLQYEVAQPM